MSKCQPPSCLKKKQPQYGMHLSLDCVLSKLYEPLVQWQLQAGGERQPSLLHLSPPLLLLVPESYASGLWVRTFLGMGAAPSSIRRALWPASRASALQAFLLRVDWHARIGWQKILRCSYDSHGIWAQKHGTGAATIALKYSSNSSNIISSAC